MKNFYFRLTVSILGMVLLSAAAIFCAVKGLYFSAAACVMVSLLLLYSIIHYARSVRKNLGLFIQNAQLPEDQVQVDIPSYGSPFRDFFTGMKALQDRQQAMEAEKFHLHQLLETIRDKTSAGIIVIPFKHEKGADTPILYINTAAANMLRIPRYNNWGRIIEKIPELDTILGRIGNGGKDFIQLPAGKELSIEAQLLASGTDTLQLLTLQDVKTEMEQKETDSWNKLIQVMTHEILNSLTPIHTMAFILEKLSRQPSLEDDDRADMLVASATIATRSKGLMQFVQDYRKVAELPVPAITKIPLPAFLSGIKTIFEKEPDASHISFHIENPDGIAALWADPNLVGQVLINLLRNAIHAVALIPDAAISITVQKMPDHICLTVTDNGKGILPEQLPQIFVPFFTSRENGSGIGLSVVRNIMRMHRGSVTVQSDGPGKGAAFHLHFPVD